MDPCPGFSADEAVPIEYRRTLRLRTERKQWERKDFIERKLRFPS